MACRGVLADISIRDVMRPCSVFVGSKDLVTRARAIVRSTGLRTLPVIDNGKLAGIITPKEIMKVTSTRSNIPVAGIVVQPQLVATPDMKLVDLAKQMVAGEVSDVPVVRGTTDRTVVGLVRLDDILRKISGKMPAGSTVGSVMSKNVVVCGPEDDISKVWDIMEETHYSGIPVVRYDKRDRIREVVGMVTRADLIKSGSTRLSEESDKGRFRNPPKVKEIMRTPGITVSSRSSLSEAIDLMVSKNVGRLPVVDGGDLVGIISRSDIIGFACR